MRQEKGSSAIGALVGFACGVGVGLLFAKKPGTETRRQIGDLIQKGRRKGEELVGRGGESIESGTESIVAQGGKEPFYESGKYT